MLPFANDPLVQIDSAYATAAAALHQTGFDMPWSKDSFSTFLNLPSTVGWMNSVALLLCSKTADELEILTICVHPSKQQKGVGSALISFLAAYARQNNIQKIFLEVSIKNLAAQGLYKKMGFQKIGVRKNYYKTQNGWCDALVLEKKVQS